MADWARGILMISMSPLLSLLFKVHYSQRAKEPKSELVFFVLSTPERTKIFSWQFAF